MLKIEGSRFPLRTVAFDTPTWLLRDHAGAGSGFVNLDPANRWAASADARLKDEPQSGELVFWLRGSTEPLQKILVKPCKTEPPSPLSKRRGRSINARSQILFRRTAEEAQSACAQSTARVWHLPNHPPETWSVRLTAMSCLHPADTHDTGLVTRAMTSMGIYFNRFRTAIQQFLNHDCLTDGAAIAYYTIFSLPPLLVIILSLTSAMGFTKADVDRVIYGELGLPETQIQTELPGDIRPLSSDGARFAIGDLGAGSQLVGLLLFLFSATGIFGQLQAALNKIWQVAPDPEQGGWRAFVFKRLLTAGMVAVIWFVLLVSLTLTAVIGQILLAVKGTAPDFIEQLIGLAINELATFAMAVLLFAAIFKILPDAQLQWRDVWVGAVLTAVLFVIGKMVIGWYLRVSEVGSSWGASAASTAAALVWVYYSSLIVLFGAELSHVCATQDGDHAIQPEPGAVHLSHSQHASLTPHPCGQVK